MIIVAGGCSFIYGSELADCHTGTTGPFGDTPSASTWTALLARDHWYQCVARPGDGNDAIARRVLNAVHANGDAKQAVVVQWSLAGRYEFSFNDGTANEWRQINPWHLLSPREVAKIVGDSDTVIRDWHVNEIEQIKNSTIREFVELFYKNIGSWEFWQTYTTLKEIVNLQNYLELRDIPYLFTFSDTDFMNNRSFNGAEPSIVALRNQLDLTKTFLFPSAKRPSGFYQWAQENKYRMGTTHPLEEAHRDAAELIKGKFNEMVTKQN